MRRSWLSTRYIWAVAIGGLALWIWTLIQAAPWRSGANLLTGSTYQELLVLTVLSTLSPIETRGGGVLTVTLAPLFGAVALPLPPWAVMTVAALGSIDLRVPGKQIPWYRFAFNRSMLIFAYGVPSLLLSDALRHSPNSTPYLLLLAAVMVISINSLLMATAIRLMRGTG